MQLKNEWFFSNETYMVILCWNYFGTGRLKEVLLTPKWETGIYLGMSLQPSTITKILVRMRSCSKRHRSGRSNSRLKEKQKLIHPGRTNFGDERENENHSLSVDQTVEVTTGKDMLKSASRDAVYLLDKKRHH